MTDLERKEITKTPQNDGFIEDWGNLQSRVNRAKTVTNEKEDSSLFSEIKNLESRLKNNEKVKE